jgi:asparagine synthase (glutamine-hydrolysing)
MCGIAGELRHDDREVDPAAVARMTAALRPRGPDDTGLWSSARAALGHRRLSIIDTSSRGAQPMVDMELGLTVVFNGCIYNHRELRQELEDHGYRFASSGDTEVLLKAYHRWGERFVDRLRGMFALCIVERDGGRAVLARDRLGIKPLYLDERPGCLRFASTLPALLAGGGVDTDLDVAALHQHLTLHGIVPAPRTLVRGVRKLPPATVLVVEPDGRRRATVYWDPRYERPTEGRSPEEWEGALLDALRTAVERRMVADVPVGVLLSGGLDSSLIVALLAELGCPDLQTFSIGFDAVGGEAGDEFRWSDLVAERFGTRHHRLAIPHVDVAGSLVDAVRAMSEPMASHDAVAFYLLSQAVAEHVKVVQSGQGADEVLGGYWWHQPFAEVARHDAAEVFLRTFADRTHHEVRATLAARLRPLADDASRDLVAEDMARPGATTALDAVLRLDVGRLMPDDPVKRVDNMTMASGLEARVPFLDHELVELAAQCPPELKLADGGKGILKTIGRRVLPHELIERPKGYFPVPGLRQLEGPLLGLVRDVLTDPAARSRDLFDVANLDRLLLAPNEHRSASGANLLWQLAVVELWLQEHLDRRARTDTGATVGPATEDDEDEERSA